MSIEVCVDTAAIEGTTRHTGRSFREAADAFAHIINTGDLSKRSLHTLGLEEADVG